MASGSGHSAIIGRAAQQMAGCVVYYVLSQSRGASSAAGAAAGAGAWRAILIYGIDDVQPVCWQSANLSVPVTHTVSLHAALCCRAELDRPLLVAAQVVA